MGENLCQLLISRIYWELKKLNPQIISIPMKKWGYELNRERMRYKWAVNT
jgi:hypothetical protein